MTRLVFGTALITNAMLFCIYKPEKNGILLA